MYTRIQVGRTDGRTNGWIDEQTDTQTDGQIDRRTGEHGQSNMPALLDSRGIILGHHNYLCKLSVAWEFCERLTQSQTGYTATSQELGHALQTIIVTTNQTSVWRYSYIVNLIHRWRYNLKYRMYPAISPGGTQLDSK